MRRLRMRGLTLFLVLAATGSCGVSTGGSGGDPVDRGGGIMARPDLGCPLGEVPRGGACAPNLPSCATTGGCLPDQPYCDDVGHFAVTPEIVVDRETGLGVDEVVGRQPRQDVADHHDADDGRCDRQRHAGDGQVPAAPPFRQPGR